MSYTCATLRSRHYAAFFPCFSTIYEGVFKFRASLALACPDRGAERETELNVPCHHRVVCEVKR